uniref:Uncharacterized protein n=1 Tax=Branchiostoma floridae TaxID=7739 RepID=C3ZWS2_BRAFL|eukprot:XP_002586980.1 hypothetical protein BRAFLDRAFT_102101 [Branchiostoma floridae]
MTTSLLVAALLCLSSVSVRGLTNAEKDALLTGAVGLGNLDIVLDPDNGEYLIVSSHGMPNHTLGPWGDGNPDVPTTILPSPGGGQGQGGGDQADPAPSTTPMRARSNAVTSTLPICPNGTGNPPTGRKWKGRSSGSKAGLSAPALLTVTLTVLRML